MKRSGNHLDDDERKAAKMRKAENLFTEKSMPYLLRRLRLNLEQKEDDFNFLMDCLKSYVEFGSTFRKFFITCFEQLPAQHYEEMIAEDESRKSKRHLIIMDAEKTLSKYMIQIFGLLRSFVDLVKVKNDVEAVDSFIRKTFPLARTADTNSLIEILSAQRFISMAIQLDAKDELVIQLSKIKNFRKIFIGLFDTICSFGIEDLEILKINAKAVENLIEPLNNSNLQVDNAKVSLVQKAIATYVDSTPRYNLRNREIKEYIGMCAPAVEKTSKKSTVKAKSAVKAPIQRDIKNLVHDIFGSDDSDTEVKIHIF